MTYSLIAQAGRHKISQLNELRTAQEDRRRSAGDSLFARSVDSVDGKYSPEAQFRNAPGQTHLAKKLFQKTTCENLPEHIRDAVMSADGEAVKNLLGILAKNILPKDKDNFNRACMTLLKSMGEVKKERKIAAKLNSLLVEYGRESLNKYVSDYTQHCREAWKQNHIGDKKNIADEAIFKSSMRVCQGVFEHQIAELTKPNQSWETMAQYAEFFKATCIALPRTLKHHESSQTESKPPVSVARNIPRPITVSNTAHGSSSIAMTNGVSREDSTTSDIDFGIELLRTPDKELAGEKARLIDEFMALRWGRAKGGGQYRKKQTAISGEQTDPATFHNQGGKRDSGLSTITE